MEKSCKGLRVTPHSVRSITKKEKQKKLDFHDVSIHKKTKFLLIYKKINKIHKAIQDDKYIYIYSTYTHQKEGCVKNQWITVSQDFPDVYIYVSM